MVVVVGYNLFLLVSEHMIDGHSQFAELSLQLVASVAASLCVHAPVPTINKRNEFIVQT